MKKTLIGIYNSVKSGEMRRFRVSRKYKRIGFKDGKGHYFVYLTVSTLKPNAKVVQGKGKTLKKAIKNAVKLLYKSMPKYSDTESIKLEIVVDKKFLGEYESKSKKIPKGFQRRYCGLSFDPDLRTSFTSAEITSYQIIRARKFNLNNAKRAILNQVRDKKVSIHEIESAKADLYSIETIVFFYNKEFGFKVIDPHEEFKLVDKEYLLSSIALTKDFYFKNVVGVNGKFIYSYLPTTNEAPKEYNILRHSGTIYSMMETYELMPDEKLLENIERAIEYLLTKIESENINGVNTKVIVERDRIKLGGNALAIVALAKYTTVTGNKQYLDYMLALAQWMIETQNDHGEFSIHIQEFSTKQVTDFVSRFYPGEAILALVRLYRITQNEQLLETAVKAADFLINNRDRNETTETITPDHWLLYGLNDLFTFRPSKVYSDHAELMASAIISKQILDKNIRRKHWYGGFQTRPQKAPGLTNTACWSEGLGATYQLAKKSGNTELKKLLKKTLIKSVSFQLQAQFRPESTMLFENKKLSIGGMPKSFNNNEIRIDYTQHNISSFILLYNILNQ